MPRPLPAIMLCLSLLASAMTATAQHATPYAGQDARTIASLSDADIAEVRRGGGWELAKAAEFNGAPGPAHLLELKDEIPLTAEQVAAIAPIFRQMQADAIATGEALIAAEAALDAAFVAGSLTPESLRTLLADVERHRAELRYIHLITHLTMPALLTPEQIARYKALRGYSTDACSNIPAGHDPAMWKKHNGCN